MISCLSEDAKTCGRVSAPFGKSPAASSIHIFLCPRHKNRNSGLTPFYCKLRLQKPQTSTSLLTMSLLTGSFFWNPPHKGSTTHAALLWPHDSLEPFLALTVSAVIDLHFYSVRTDNVYNPSYNHIKSSAFFLIGQFQKSKVNKHTYTLWLCKYYSQQNQEVNQEDSIFFSISQIFEVLPWFVSSFIFARNVFESLLSVGFGKGRWRWLQWEIQCCLTHGLCP